MRSLATAGLLAASSAQAQSIGGHTIVAVIDSGVAATAELQPLLIGEVDVAARPARPAYQPTADHGTKVATVLARAAGPQVRILSIRVDEPVGCAPGLRPPCQRNAEAIAWAIYEAMARRADIINISMALPDTPVISRAIAFASWQGRKVVLASGNNGLLMPGNLSHARAGYPNTVLVGALEANGTPWAGSNRPGPGPVTGYSFSWRQGVNLPTSRIDGSATTATGTSIAAPIEAGYRAQRQMAAPPLVMRTAFQQSAMVRRPVMLANAVFPDVRAQSCRTPASPKLPPRCFGSELIA